MQSYRVIFLGADGRDSDCEDVVCRDDDDVIDRIGRRDHAFGIEVWSGDRLVAQFGAVGAARSWRLGR
jgi:hypothetical protein